MISKKKSQYEEILVHYPAMSVKQNVINFGAPKLLGLANRK